MIKTFEDLRDWILMHKVPPEIAANPTTMTYWERAISNPTLGKIYTYWVMAGMDAHIKDQILWGAIRQSAGHQSTLA